MTRVMSISGGTSIKILGEKGEQEFFFLGGGKFKKKNVRVQRTHENLPLLCSNCQIWANFN